MTATLDYLRDNWAEVYEITAAGGVWKAVARFGRRDVLTAGGPDALLIKIRRHYHPRTPGAERMST